MLGRARVQGAATSACRPSLAALAAGWFRALLYKTLEVNSICGLDPSFKPQPPSVHRRAPSESRNQWGRSWNPAHSVFCCCFLRGTMSETKENQSWPGLQNDCYIPVSLEEGYSFSPFSTSLWNPGHELTFSGHDFQGDLSCSPQSTGGKRTTGRALCPCLQRTFCHRAAASSSDHLACLVPVPWPYPDPQFKLCVALGTVYSELLYHSLAFTHCLPTILLWKAGSP